MDYAKHVAKIAKANGVKLVFVDNFYDCAGHIYDRVVYILPIVDERTYAIAMHELGHVLGPMQDYFKYRRSSLTFAHAEIGAWIWAKQNTQYWLVSMQETMRQCIESYNQNPPNSRYRFKKPVECVEYGTLF